MSESKIYNRLPVLRAERGLSRLGLANAIGVNYQTIGYLERGEYSSSHSRIDFCIPWLLVSAEKY